MYREEKLRPGSLGRAVRRLNTNADVSLGPHVLTGRAHARVPLDKVGEGDAVVADDLVARVAFGHIVELLAVGHHSRLRGLGRSHAVAGGRGGDRRLRRGSRRRRGAPDDADAHIHLGPHAAAVGAHACVPLGEVGEADAIVAEDLAAGDALGNPVELVAVGHHARLRRLRCLDAVARGRGGGSHGFAGSCRRRRGRGSADDANADVDFGPHARTFCADVGVPLGKVGETDVCVAEDLAAGDPGRDKVELVAVGHHAGLNWCRSGHAIPGNRCGGRGSGGGCQRRGHTGSGSGRGRGRRSPVLLDAVRVACDKGTGGRQDGVLVRMSVSNIQVALSSQNVQLGLIDIILSRHMMLDYREQTYVCNKLSLSDPISGSHSLAGIRCAGDKPPGAVRDGARIRGRGWWLGPLSDSAEAQKLRNKA